MLASEAPGPPGSHNPRGGVLDIPVRPVPRARPHPTAIRGLFEYQSTSIHSWAADGLAAEMEGKSLSYADHALVVLVEICSVQHASTVRETMWMDGWLYGDSIMFIGYISPRTGVMLGDDSEQAINHYLYKVPNRNALCTMARHEPSRK